MKNLQLIMKSIRLDWHIPMKYHRDLKQIVSASIAELLAPKKAMDDIATEHIEDRDEDGEYVIKRPEKAKKTTTRHSNNYYDYSKVKNIEEAEELDDEEY